MVFFYIIMNNFFIAFQIILCVSLVMSSLWALVESIIIKNTYRTTGTILQINSNNMTVDITNKQCSNFQNVFDCGQTCSNYRLYNSYTMWCNCLVNQCSFDKNISMGNITIAFYLFFGFFIVLVLSSYCGYICSSLPEHKKYIMWSCGYILYIPTILFIVSMITYASLAV